MFSGGAKYERREFDLSDGRHAVLHIHFGKVHYQTADLGIELLDEYPVYSVEIDGKTVLNKQIPPLFHSDPGQIERQVRLKFEDKASPPASAA